MSHLKEIGYVREVRFDGRKRYVESLISFRAERNNCSGQDGTFVPHNNIENDRRAQQRRDGIEGQHSDGRKIAEEITEEREQGAGKHGGRQKRTMVVGAKQQKGHMRRGKSKKGNRAAIGCNNSSEQSCGKKEQIANKLHVDAQIDSIAFAQQQSIKGLDKQGCQYKS